MHLLPEENKIVFKPFSYSAGLNIETIDYFSSNQNSALYIFSVFCFFACHLAWPHAVMCLQPGAP